jgi:hypothetical protein
MANHNEEQYQLDLATFPEEIKTSIINLFQEGGTTNKQLLRALTQVVKDHKVNTGFEDNIPKGGTAERTCLAIVQLYEKARGKQSVAEPSPSHLRTLEGLLYLWSQVEEDNEEYGEEAEPTRQTRILKKAGTLGRTLAKERLKIDQARNPKLTIIPVTDSFTGNLESATGTGEKITTHLAQMGLGFMTRSPTLHQPSTQPNDRERSTALAFLAKACEDGEMKGVTREARDAPPGTHEFLDIYHTVTFKGDDLDEDIKASKRDLQEKKLIKVKQTKIKGGESANTLADRIDQDLNEIVELGGLVDDYLKKEIIMRAVEGDSRFTVAVNFLEAQRNMPNIDYAFVKKRLQEAGNTAQRKADHEHEQDSIIDAKIRPLTAKIAQQTAQIKQLKSQGGRAEGGNTTKFESLGEAGREKALEYKNKMGYHVPIDPEAITLMDKVLKLSADEQAKVTTKVATIPDKTTGYYELVRKIWRETLSLPKDKKRAASPYWMNRKSR